MSQSASPTIDKIDQKILENVNRLLQTWPANPSASEIVERDNLIAQILDIYAGESHSCYDEAYNIVNKLNKTCGHSGTKAKIDRTILDEIDRILQEWPTHPSETDMKEKNSLVEKILERYGDASHCCHEKAFSFVVALRCIAQLSKLLLRSTIENFPSDEPSRRAQLVGSGSFAEVYKATCNGKCVAMKVFYRNPLSKPEEKLNEFLRELQIWQKIPSHPNVLQFHGCYLAVNFSEQDIDFALVSPLAKKDLGGFHAHTKPQQLVGGLILGIAKGLKHLHEIAPNAIIHGDLCTENILLEQNDNGHIAMLADFGTAKHNLTRSTITVQGFVRGMRYERVGPELARNPDGSRTLKTDIFAMGSLIYKSFTGEIPEFGLPNVLNPPDRHAHLRNTALDAVWTLIQICWSEDPNSRPSARNIVDTMVTICENIPEETSAQAFRRFRTNDT